MSLSPSVCQDCGARGYENSTEDVMPSTCPRCFERRIRPVFLRPQSLAALREGLIAAGCTTPRIDVLLFNLLKRFETKGDQQ